MKKKEEKLIEEYFWENFGGFFTLILLSNNQIGFG